MCCFYSKINLITYPLEYKIKWQPFEYIFYHNTPETAFFFIVNYIKSRCSVYSVWFVSKSKFIVVTRFKPLCLLKVIKKKKNLIPLIFYKSKLIFFLSNKSKVNTIKTFIEALYNVALLKKNIISEVGILRSK